jgi:hypothetical protein
MSTKEDYLKAIGEWMTMTPEEQSRAMMEDTLREFKEWAKDKRAQYLYYRCLSHGHVKWAEAIKRKYDIDQHDSVLAMEIVLRATKGDNI